MAYIQVARSETSRNIMELPLEDDNTLDMATLTSQFPNAIGLKFKADSGAWRGLKVSGNCIYHPGGEWLQDSKYVVSYNVDNKRKADEEEERDSSSKRSVLTKQPTDLVVLNMPYDTTEDDMRTYFEKFGELTFSQLKKKSDGSSRGYGFIRFKDIEDQRAVCREVHKMGDRTLEVKIPQSKAAGFEDVVRNSAGSQRLCRRVHVGNVTSRITKKDLETYFGQFGHITDIFLPKETSTRQSPMYAFLTFEDEDEARSLVESTQSHTIHGDTLNVAYASPIQKSEPRKSLTVAFQDVMDQFVENVYYGKFGNDKPRSRTEATGMAMVLMRRYIEMNGGGYDERDRNARSGHDRYRHDDYLTNAFAGNSDLSGYGGTPSLMDSMYGAAAGRYPKM